jgi:hypothetical protein
VPEKRINGLVLMLYRPAGESTPSTLWPQTLAFSLSAQHHVASGPGILYINQTWCMCIKRPPLRLARLPSLEHSLSSGPSRPGAKNAEDGVDSHCRVFCRSVSRCLIALTPLFTLTAGVSTPKSSTSSSNI